MDFLRTLYLSRAVLALTAAFFTIGATKAVALFRDNASYESEFSQSLGFETFQVYVAVLVWLLDT